MMKRVRDRPREGTDAPRTFEEFYLAQAARLGKALYLLTGSREEADDLLQESMARTMVRWNRVGAMESPAGYVYRVALNLHRRKFRRRSSVGGPVPTDTIDLGFDAEARVMLLEGLRALDAGQREALLLVTWIGMSPEEAGRVLHIKPASVRSRVHRARAALREHLGGTDDA